MDIQNTVTATMTIMTFATGLSAGAVGRPFLSSPQSIFLGSTELASPASLDLAFSLNESNVSDKFVDDGRFDDTDFTDVEGADDSVFTLDIYATRKLLDK